MAGIADILKLEGLVTHLAADQRLFDAIGKIVPHYEEIVTAISDFEPILAKDAFLKFLATRGEDPRLDPIFAAVGLDDELATVRASTDRVLALTGLGDGGLGMLLEPLGSETEKAPATAAAIDNWDYGSNDRLFRIPLLSADADTGPASAKYQFEVGAEASVEAEVGALWPFVSDQVVEPLFRLGVKGTLKAGARAKLPFASYGSLAIGAQGTANATCQLFYYQRDPARPVAAQLGRAVGRMPNPFEYQEIWQGFAQSELGGIILTFKGVSKVNVEVALAREFDLGNLIDAKAGLTLSVGVERAGDYVLSLRGGRFADRATSRVRAILSRTRHSDDSFAIGVGLDFDLSKLAEQIQGPLRAALKTWDKGLDAIKPLLSPGTYLRDELDDVLKDVAAGLAGDPALKAALAADLDMALGFGAEDESAVAEWLSKQLSTAIENASNVLSAGSDAVTPVLEKLAERVPGFARDSVKGAVTDAVEKLAEALEARLTETVETIITRSGKKAVRDALQDLGAKVSSQVEDADKALAGVRDLIAQYDCLFRKVLEATKDEARQKLSLRLQWEQERISDVEYEVVGEFLDNGPAAEAIFNRLIVGDLEAIRELYDQEGPAAIASRGAFLLDQNASSVRRFSRVSSSFGYEAVLFGFGSSVKTIAIGEADVVTTGDGTIRVDDRSELRKLVKAADEQRELALINIHSLILSQAEMAREEQARMSMRVGLNITHTDEKLSLKEADAFFSGLVRARLIGEDVQRDLLAKLKRAGTTAGGNEKVGAAIALTLILTSEDTQNLMQLVSAPTGPVPDGYRGRLASFACRALRISGSWDDKEFAQDLKAIRESLAGLAPGLSDDQIVETLIARALAHGGKVPGLNRVRLDDEKKSVKADNALELSFAFADYVAKMREIVLARPGRKTAATPQLWDEHDYRRADRDLAKTLKSWLKSNKTFLGIGGFKSEMHPRNIALMVALLCGASSKAGQADDATMSWPQDRVRVTLTLQDGHKA